MSTNRSKDRSSLCSFTFVDGRHCRTPCRAGHPCLCAFHARRDAQALAGEAAGKDIAYHLRVRGLTLLSQRVPFSNRFSTIADWS